MEERIMIRDVDAFGKAFWSLISSIEDWLR